MGDGRTPMMRSTLLLAFAASVIGQDTSTSATECAGKAATTPATTYAISAIQGDFATETGDSEYCSLKGGMAYPSAKAGEYVSISGVVTAVGTQKDAYASAYYYMQMTDGTTAFAGIEVFAEDHKHMRGDELTVKGVVREVYGVTELVECFATKTGSAATLPAPIELSTDDFQGCTEHAEQYEGMLVSLGAVEVQPCQNPLTEALIAAGGKGGFYCQANLENVAWGQVFDKYKQMWVLSRGASGLPMEVDNHAVELAVEYVCATGPTTYATWTNLIGVVTYAYGTWDLIPRDKFDVAGGKSKTPASVGAVDVNIMQILQTSVKYGNSDAGGPFSVPKQVMGTATKNSKGELGYGGYALPQPGAAWTEGSCPPYEVLDWLDDSGNKTQNLCSCYPPNFYDPDGGPNGAGTKYVTVKGVIQGIANSKGPFYICDESCPSTGGCMFTYRRSDTELTEGDYVSMTAKVYAYYGLNQFSYPIDITVLKSGKGKCQPQTLDDMSMLTYEAGCNADAEQIEGTEVTLECVKVTMVGNDLDSDGITGEDDKSDDSTYHLQVHSCYPGGEKKYHCVLEVEDVRGNKFLVDDGTFGDGTECFFAGDCSGYQGKYVAIGDTFDSLNGFVDQRRGSHATGLGRGGYYGMMPHKSGGFTGWSSEGWSPTCAAKKAEYEASIAPKETEKEVLPVWAIGVIAGVAAAAVLLFAFVCFMRKREKSGKPIFVDAISSGTETGTKTVEIA